MQNPPYLSDEDLSSFPEAQAPSFHPELVTECRKVVDDKLDQLEGRTMTVVKLLKRVYDTLKQGFTCRSNVHVLTPGSNQGREQMY